MNLILFKNICILINSNVVFQANNISIMIKKIIKYNIKILKLNLIIVFRKIPIQCCNKKKIINAWLKLNKEFY